MWIVFILLVIVFIAGGLFILLRTAKAPKIPKAYKRRLYDDNSPGW